MKSYIIENLIPLDLQEELKECLKHQSLWYLSPTTSGPNIEIDKLDTSIADSPQMIHEIVNENQASSHIAEIAFSMCEHIENNLSLQIDNVIRIKSNMLFQNIGMETLYHPPHIDSVNLNHISAVYYVEDSDGDTLLFDKTADDGPYDLDVIKSINPKQGTVVIFPSKLFHTSKNPVQNQTRTIINFLLEADETKVVDLFYD